MCTTGHIEAKNRDHLASNNNVRVMKANSHDCLQYMQARKKGIKHIIKPAQQANKQVANSK